MKRGFLLATFLFLGLSFAASAFAATSGFDLPCYCRYPSTKSGWSKDAARYCSNQTYFSGLVNGVGDPGTVIALATAACQQRCASEGNAYVGITDQPPPEWLKYGNPNNLVAVEKNECVFRQDSPGAMDYWTAKYLDCKEPLSSIREAYPPACSLCYCKFPSGPGQDAKCAGKTTLVHQTGAPGNCPTICADLKLDATGPAVRPNSSEDNCNFRLEDSCARARNTTSPGCAAKLGQTEDQKVIDTFRANNGSALGLLLPLGNISLPGAIARIIRQLLSVVGAIALVFFVWGGVKYMTAAGDDKKVLDARNMIVAAVSGLAAIFLSYALLSLLINALN